MESTDMGKVPRRQRISGESVNKSDHIYDPDEASRVMSHRRKGHREVSGGRDNTVIIRKYELGHGGARL